MALTHTQGFFMRHILVFMALLPITSISDELIDGVWNAARYRQAERAAQAQEDMAETQQRILELEEENLRLRRAGAPQQAAEPEVKFIGSKMCYKDVMTDDYTNCVGN